MEVTHEYCLREQYRDTRPLYVGSVSAVKFIEVCCYLSMGSLFPFPLMEDFEGYLWKPLWEYLCNSSSGAFSSLYEQPPHFFPREMIYMNPVNLPNKTFALFYYYFKKHLAVYSVFHLLSPVLLSALLLPSAHSLCMFLIILESLYTGFFIDS